MRVRLTIYLMTAHMLSVAFAVAPIPKPLEQASNAAIVAHLIDREKSTWTALQRRDKQAWASLLSDTYSHVTSIGIRMGRAEVLNMFDDEVVEDYSLHDMRGTVLCPAAMPAAPVVAAVIPEALQAPDAGPEVDTQTPFANDGYIGWMNGTPRQKEPIFDTKFFTPEICLDVNYLQSSNHPIDHTISGSTEEFRSGEFQIEQVSLGGDFHWEGVKARFLSMFGMFATTTPRNDASNAVGQWDLSNAYRYFSEANAGYHWDVNHGLNVDAGVFVSYVGLFSYYNYDNWTYQPSFVSSNTPWFFNGLRVQWWPTQDLKIEP
jgi:hypothetical protein